MLSFKDLVAPVTSLGVDCKNILTGSKLPINAIFLVLFSLVLQNSLYYLNLNLLHLNLTSIFN